MAQEPLLRPMKETKRAVLVGHRAQTVLLGVALYPAPHISQALRSFPQMYPLHQLAWSITIIFVFDSGDPGLRAHKARGLPCTQPAPITISSRGSSVPGLVPLY